MRGKIVKERMQLAETVFNSGKISMQESNSDYVLIERNFLEWMLTELRAIREKLAGGKRC